MKKLKIYLSLITLSIFLFSGVASADPINSNSQGPIVSELTQQQINKSNVEEAELSQLRELHKLVVSKGLVSLNSNGEIVINTTADQLGIDTGLFDKYCANLNSVNFAVKEGGVTFDKDFNVKIATPEEITAIIYNKDLNKRSKTNNLEVVPFSDPGAPPVLQAYTIANNNFNTLYNYWSAIANGIWGDATAAYSATVSYWVGKVQSGGAWDYKVVPGYSPYNKAWQAIVKYGVVQSRTTEWFGNYNYGYTGKFLFSLSVLKIGGDAVSIKTSGAADDPADTQAITQGYNENTN